MKKNILLLSLLFCSVISANSFKDYAIPTAIGGAAGGLSYYILDKVVQVHSSTNVLISSAIGLSALGCSLMAFKYLYSTNILNNQPANLATSSQSLVNPSPNYVNRSIDNDITEEKALLSKNDIITISKDRSVVKVIRRLEYYIPDFSQRHSILIGTIKEFEKTNNTETIIDRVFQRYSDILQRLGTFKGLCFAHNINPTKKHYAEVFHDTTRTLEQIVKDIIKKRQHLIKTYIMTKEQVQYSLESPEESQNIFLLKASDVDSGIYLTMTVGNTIIILKNYTIQESCLISIEDMLKHLSENPKNAQYDMQSALSKAKNIVFDSSEIELIKQGHASLVIIARMMINDQIKQALEELSEKEYPSQKSKEIIIRGFKEYVSSCMQGGYIIPLEDANKRYQQTKERHQLEFEINDEIIGRTRYISEWVKEIKKKINNVNSILSLKKWKPTQAQYEDIFVLLLGKGTALDAVDNIFSDQNQVDDSI